MNAFWSNFAILFGLAMVGAAALTPYISRMIKASGKPTKLPLATLLLLSFVQSVVLFAGVTALGLIASHAVGLGAPHIDALVGQRPHSGDLAQIVSLAVIAGGAAGLFLLVADLALLPRLPAFLDLARSTSLWENFAASFYGGINEELLTRLLGVSGVVWLLNRAPYGLNPVQGEATYWTAIIIMAIVFAVGHLPAARSVAGRITPLILARTLALNIPVALLCGWLFWRFGIEAAMIAHFVADIVYHVGGTALLRANDRFHFWSWIPPATSMPTSVDQ